MSNSCKIKSMSIDRIGEVLEQEKNKDTSKRLKESATSTK